MSNLNQVQSQFSREKSKYAIAEMVQLRPYSAVCYTRVLNMRELALGNVETLKQSQPLSEELKEFGKIDDLTEIGGINIYASQYKKLYDDDNKANNYNKKELGTLSRVQLRKVKKILSLFSYSEYAGKYLAFLTLTLPSRQMHHDRVIRRCLSLYLDLLKKTKGLDNYVWKAEPQKNGNIHFHLLIDRFIDKEYLQKKWNVILNKLGYIDKYTEKMNNTSLKEYLNVRKKWKNFNEKTALRAYIRGRANGWKTPTSTKVETPKSKEKIQGYLIKYFLKQEEDKRPVIGAVWGCSNKVKNLNYPTLFLDNCHAEFEHLKTKLNSVELDNDFVEIYEGKVYDLIKGGYKRLNTELKINNDAIVNYLNDNTDVSFYEHRQQLTIKYLN